MIRIKQNPNPTTIPPMTWLKSYAESHSVLRDDNGSIAYIK